MAAFEAEDEPDPPSEDSDDSTVAELITFSFPNSALWSPCCAKSALTLHYHKEKFALRQLLHFEFRLHVGSKLHWKFWYQLLYNYENKSHLTHGTTKI